MKLIIACWLLIPALIRADGSSMVMRQSRSESLVAVARCNNHNSADEVKQLVVLNQTSIHDTTLRILQQSDSYFVPLSCNQRLDDVDCRLWSTVIGTANTFTERVVIDCGTCVRLDRNQVVLQQGLDIRGKLILDENFTQDSVLLRTSSITVQGKLEMRSSKPIDGSPTIHIVLIGNDKQSFAPVGENAWLCSDKPKGECAVDQKAITVAGGKVNIQGIDADTKTWLRLYNVTGGTTNRPTSIIVPASGVLDKWLPGAEILITSFNRQWNNQQVRSIIAVTTVDAPNNYITLELDSPIHRPTTLLESPDFAVEVAMLSRNIVFEGGNTNPQDGGHFWIMNTEKIPQIIQGVDIRYFGIQGTMGRYPIHFHYCGDSSGSLVSKNTIRQSHQRCIVVHGTNNVHVEDNVAFDTRGHCFILEDGIETGNSFLRNLGAQIDAPTTVIPNNGETDKEPAIFWITHPSNNFQNNVAAGSVGSSFWYELKSRGPLASRYPDPIHEPLGIFDSNVAHSSAGKTGAVRMYPTGYLPKGKTEAIFTGLKVYRNLATGIFVHRVQNFEISFALFADNGIGVDLDRSEAITVSDSTIIGMSDSYRALIMQDSKTGKTCNHRGEAIGIDLHSWRLRRVKGGFYIKNVAIRGFDGVQCPKTSGIRMDTYSLKQSAFEVYTSFYGMNIDVGVDIINFCEAKFSGIDSIYLIDLDGSLDLSMNSTMGPSALVSDSSKMMAFVDPSRCTLVTQGCYQYCQETCFNSIRYEVDSSQSQGYRLKVCQRGQSTGCIEMPWLRRSNEKNPFQNDPRTFLIHLPPGNYDAEFVNELGNRVWPTYVARRNEETLCSASIDVRVLEPAPDANVCTDLIRNGNADADNTLPLFWFTAFGGLEIARGVGVEGTNALAGGKFSNAKIIQYLDTRCLVVGKTYNVKGKVKLLKASGEIFECNPNKERCPTVGVYVKGVGDIELSKIRAESEEGFQLIETTFTVDSAMAGSDLVFVFVEWLDRQAKPQKAKLLVDNFFVTQRISDTPTSSPVLPPFTPKSNETCSDLIENSNMEDGDITSYWDMGDSIIAFLRTTTDGFQSSHAMRYDAAIYGRWGPQYNTKKYLDWNCFTFDSQWIISAQVRLINPWFGWGETCSYTSSCPQLQFQLFDGQGKVVVSVESREYMNSSWQRNHFNELSTTFALPSRDDGWDGIINNITIRIGGYLAFLYSKTLLLDNFTIKPIHL